MAIAEAGRSVRKDILVICHGGPFDEPENVGKALARMPGIAGFFGAVQHRAAAHRAGDPGPGAGFQAAQGGGTSAQQVTSVLS